MTDREFRGVFIPREIWLDNNMTLLEKAIFVEIDSLDKSDQGCFASNTHFAEMFGCSERKVSDAISKLTQNGYVKVLHFDGRIRYLRSCMRVVLNADTKSVLGSLTKSASLPNEMFQSASRDFPHSNSNSIPDRNTFSSDIDNPYGDPDGAPELNKDTAEFYALEHLGDVKPSEMDDFHFYQTKLPDDVIRMVVDTAVCNGAREWRYVLKILGNYVKDGITTLDEAKAAREAWKKRHGLAEDKPAKRKDWDEMTEEERKKALASGPFGKWVD